MGEPKHVVAIIGGAVSGSVATEILADHGIEVVVIEQNDRPYGKIEDGLPLCHVHQRNQEYGRIDARLNRPEIHFVPKTKLGADVAFEDLTGSWGLSAVLLANGAWRDRPFLESAYDEHQWNGFVYQNPFIYWFNHKNEKAYAGPKVETPDRAIIFGGGLASIDCVKVCQFEIYERALKERGIEVSMLEMDKKGIPATCEKHGVKAEDLGLDGCILLYRRRLQDMPLAQPPPNATPEQMEKTLAARAKLLSRAQEKYLFRVQDKTLPQELIVKDGRVCGAKTIRTEVEGRKATPIPDTEETFESDLIISSIGSVPEKIPGINRKGETYTFSDWDLGVYEGAEGVFGVGNVVTGQGNIRASLLHSKKVSQYLTENYFGGATGAAAAEAVTEHLKKKDPLPSERVEKILQRVRALQGKAKYSDGAYAQWIERVTPPDLE